MTQRVGAVGELDRRGLALEPGLPNSSVCVTEIGQFLEQGDTRLLVSAGELRVAGPP